MATAAHEIDRMLVTLIGDASSYRAMMRDASAVTRQTESLVGRSGRKMASALMGATKAAAAFGVAAASAAAAGVFSLGTLAVKLAAEAEQTQIAFEVMTGSAETASKLIADIRQMAAFTPFSAADLEVSTKMLLNFGLTAQDVIDDLDRLSNVAAGDKNRLQSLALVFGQVAANGKLMGQDLLQFINAGFNPLLEISKRTGESMTELRDRMSQGLVTFDEVRQAFIDVTSEGGRFYKMNEQQSETLLGMWSTLKDNVTAALREIGQAITEEFDMKQVLKDTQDFIKTFKETWGPFIIEGIKNAGKAVGVLLEYFKKISAFVEDLQYQLALTKLQEQGKFLNFNLEEFKAYIKLHKDLDKELQNINQTLKDNKITTFAEAEAGMSQQPRTTGKIPPELQGVRDFLDSMDKEANQKMKEDARKLIESLKTPQEKLKEEFEKTKELFANGLIDQQTFDKAKAKYAKEAMDIKDSFGKSIKGMAEPIKREMDQITAIEGVGRGIDAQLRIANSIRNRGVGVDLQFKPKAGSAENTTNKLLEKGNTTQESILSLMQQEKKTPKVVLKPANLGG